MLPAISFLAWGGRTAHAEAALHLPSFARAHVGALHAWGYAVAAEPGVAECAPPSLVPSPPPPPCSCPTHTPRRKGTLGIGWGPDLVSRVRVHRVYTLYRVCTRRGLYTHAKKKDSMTFLKSVTLFKPESPARTHKF